MGLIFLFLSRFILFLLIWNVLYYRVRIGHYISYVTRTSKWDTNSRALWCHDKVQMCVRFQKEYLD
jgi:hypothetical protein